MSRRSSEYRVQAGDLRHLLYIQTFTETQDENGALVKTWKDQQPTIWGSVRPMTANEIDRGDRINSRGTHRIQIRFNEGLKASQRFRFGTRFFNIEGIRLIDEVKKTQVITVIELQD